MGAAQNWICHQPVPAPQLHHDQKPGPTASGEFLGTTCLMLNKLPTHSSPTPTIHETPNEGDYLPGQLGCREAGGQVVRAPNGHQPAQVLGAELVGRPFPGRREEVPEGHQSNQDSIFNPKPP